MKLPFWPTTIRLTAVTLLSQMAISWPLWSGRGRHFPEVPVLTGLEFPENLLSLGLVVALLALLWRPASRWASGLALGAMALLVLDDWSRLQPWLYLDAWLLATGLALSDASQRRAAICLILAGTWLWSGLHKLNPHFIAEFFPRLSLHALPDVFGYAMGLFEALAGLLMLFPRTRMVALPMGIMVHSFILIAFGPIFLNWNMVIWPWNLQFIGMILLLWPFVWRQEMPGLLHSVFQGMHEAGPSDTARVADQPSKYEQIAGPRTGAGNRWTTVLMPALAAAVLLLPALNLLGIWDHFVSGNLYSARVEGMTFFCDTADRDRLPMYVVPYQRHAAGQNRDEIILALWALGEMEVPMYPEVRVGREVAASLCKCLSVPENAGLEIVDRHLDGTESIRILPCRQLLPENDLLSRRSAR